MTGLYLVTGFLGAGKTTFLNELVKFFPGMRIAIIINEFGSADVDGLLLSRLSSAVYSVTGGSIFCACRLNQFEDALRAAVAGGPDLIIVEASGLSDPGSVMRVLEGLPEREAIVYRGCICVADASRLYKLYETARVVKKQLSAADVALLNKCDLADAAVRLSVEALQNHLPLSKIYVGEYGCASGDFKRAVLELQPRSRDEGLIAADISLHSMAVSISPGMRPEQLERFIAMFAEGTFRVKGIVALLGGTYHVDCVGGRVSVKQATGIMPGENNTITVLYGYGLPAKERLSEAMAWYPGEASLQV
jgi:G3E family GTPase